MSQSPSISFSIIIIIFPEDVAAGAIFSDIFQPSLKAYITAFPWVLLLDLSPLKNVEIGLNWKDAWHSK